MLKNTFYNLFTGLLFLLFCYLLYWSIFVLENIDQKLTALGITGILLTGLITLVTISINNLQAKKREYDSISLKEKLASYEFFYVAIVDIIRTKNENQNRSGKKLVSDLTTFKKGLMGWGSERLIKQYIDFENDVFYSEHLTIAQKVERIDKILKEIRREFGYKDSKKLKLFELFLEKDARNELHY